MIRFKNPHAYVVIFLLIALSTLLTWIIPSGSFDRVVDNDINREIAVPGSFKYVENKKVGIFDSIKAIPEGVVASAPIIAFSFIVAGSIQVIRATGAIDSGILKLVEIFKDRDVVFLVIITIVFSLLPAVGFPLIGVLPFIPLGSSIAVALGYDRVVGFHIIRTSAWVGFASAFLNPMTLGVAHEISGLPIFSGIGYRIFSFTIFISIAIIFFLSYARKIKNNPKESILYGYKSEESEKQFELSEDIDKFTARHGLVLLIFLGNLIMLLFGSLKLGWGTIDLAAIFLTAGVIGGLVGGLSPNEIGENLSIGMNRIAFGALIIGFARAASIILDKGMILDTIVNSLSKPLVNLPSYLTAVGMFIIQSIINFFIGSGSGQAAVTMPIMAPLSDLVGVTRQTAVLAFQYGDGITNMIFPQMIYIIAFADIPYNRWVKHIWRLVLYLSLAGSVLVAIAGLIEYGPF